MSENRSGQGRPGARISVVSEIVLSMGILMLAAILLIIVMVNWTYAALPSEYFEYAAFILVPYILLFALTVGVFGWRLIQRLIIRPLNILEDATQAVAAGDLDRRVPVLAENEIGRLTRSFNEMTEKLKQGRAALEKTLAETRLLNEELAQAQREVLSAEKLASVGRLAAGVAHEIGNPLSAIAGYLEILSRRAYLAEGDRDMLSRVRGEVQRIHEIIRELLDYSRPQHAGEGLVDLNEVVGAALTLITCGQKGWERVEVATELGQVPVVFCNRSALQQLVMNLALNAAQAMAGGGRLLVATRAAEHEGRPGAELRVTDTGPGIPPDLLLKVFDPFFTTKEPGQGTGLGLSICQRIVDNMRGRITLHSPPGGGATFNVWLPAAEPASGKEA